MSPKEGAGIGGVIGLVGGSVLAAVATAVIKKPRTAMNVGGLAILAATITGSVIGAGKGTCS